MFQAGRGLAKKSQAQARPGHDIRRNGVQWRWIERPDAAGTVRSHWVAVGERTVRVFPRYPGWSLWLVGVGVGDDVSIGGKRAEYEAFAFAAAIVRLVRRRVQAAKTS